MDHMATNYYDISNLKEDNKNESGDIFYPEGKQNENDDKLEDAKTYSDTQEKEEEEKKINGKKRFAVKKIIKVFIISKVKIREFNCIRKLMRSFVKTLRISLKKKFDLDIDIENKEIDNFLTKDSLTIIFKGSLIDYFEMLIMGKNEKSVKDPLDSTKDQNLEKVMNMKEKVYSKNDKNLENVMNKEVNELFKLYTNKNKKDFIEGKFQDDFEEFKKKATDRKKKEELKKVKVLSETLPSVIYNNKVSKES